MSDNRSAREQAKNRTKASVRAKVEHPFGVVKHLWGYRKVRYDGLVKNSGQIFTLFMLSNIYRARRSLRMIQEWEASLATCFMKSQIVFTMTYTA